MSAAVDTTTREVVERSALRAEIEALTYTDPSSIKKAELLTRKARAAVEVAQRAGVLEIETRIDARDAERVLGRMLLAARAAGDLAERGQDQGNVRTTNIMTLADLGVKRNAAADAVAFAMVDDDTWQTWLASPDSATHARMMRLIRDMESDEKRRRRTVKQKATVAAGTTVDIRHGDFRQVLADLTDVDAIITDPPYPREYLPLLADLAAWADKALTPDGVLAVLFGQTYLPEVYRLLDGHRPYRWTMCYLTLGAAYTSMSARLQSNWKPVLVYGGGPRFNDTVRADGATDAAAKSRHEWGQDYGAFETLVNRLTEPGQTVADPFMGSGTTLLAAKTLGRHAIGCDTDEQHVATARERLS